MTGNFQQRMSMLEDNVGGGKLEGKITIDQVYARYQHEANLHHVGGKRKFLTTGITEEAPRGLQSLARSVLRGDLNIVMARVMIRVTERVVAIEPKELGDMARSARITVTDRNAIVFERKGEHRLSEAEIEAKRAKRRARYKARRKKP